MIFHNKFRSIIFIIICFFSSPLFSQYDRDDNDLILSTFSRKLDSGIIRKYLFSEKVEKVNAALLSIANCRDTSFINDILKLNFEKFHQYILFTLRQFGESKKASKFITEVLSTQADVSVRSDLLTTFAYVCDSASAIEHLQNKKCEPGIPFTMVQFYNRQMLPSNAGEYLIDALQKVESDDLAFEILFALYRIGPPQSTDTIFTQYLLSGIKNKNILDNKLFALGCLRKLKSFSSELLIDHFLNQSEWRLRSEAAKTICYFEFKTQSQLDRYLKLIDDLNPNVALSAASSVKELKFSPELKSILRNKIISQIQNDKLSNNIRGELFVSLSSLFPDEAIDLIERFEHEIEYQFLNRALSLCNDDYWKYHFLERQVKEASEKDLLSIAPSLLELQNKLKFDNDLNKILNSLLASDYASTISTIADGLDSMSVEQNSAVLQQIIMEQCFKYMNDSKYLESIISLVNLSSKISEEFKFSLLELLSSSNLVSIKSLVNSEKSINDDFIKTLGILDQITAEAFEYKYANVETNKGIFRIKLFPEFAPVSCGNFIHLAKNKFYDNIIFHRVVPGFVIQIGDPDGTGWGGPGYEIISEYSPLKFERAMVGMASAGRDTEGSQLFVMHSYHPHLNERYTIFGEVIDGMENVDVIEQNDYIKEIQLER